MIVRVLIKHLYKFICYPMSYKKIHGHWKRPIEQSKQEKQQKTAKSYHQQLKNRKELAKKQSQKMKKFQAELNKQYLKINQSLKSKKLFESSESFKQKKQINQKNSLKKNLLLTIFNKSATKSQLFEEALKFHNLKDYPKLKIIINEIKKQFGNQGVQTVLHLLFQGDFQQLYDDLIPLNIKFELLSSQIINSIIFNLIDKAKFSKLEKILKTLFGMSTQVNLRKQEFFQLLFFNEISKQMSFEYGQESIKFSLHNLIFAKKLQIASLYLNLITKNNSWKKLQTIPIWLDKIIKIVLNFRFCKRKFKEFLTKILTNHNHVIPQNYMEQKIFHLVIKQFYFGNQQDLKIILNLFSNLNKSVNFSIIYKKFNDALMNYRIEHQSSAFNVDQQLINAYKRGFSEHKKYLAIICSVIASDDKYVDLAQHYYLNYMRKFTNETLNSEDTKIVQEGIISNYDSLNNNQKQKKLLSFKIKSKESFIVKLKCLIKLGDYAEAWKIFQTQKIKTVAIERLRKIIQIVLIRVMELRDSTNNQVQVFRDQFIQTLDNDYLWKLYKRSEDISSMLKNYIPQDKFSFWEQRQKKQQFQQISRKVASGQILKTKQPQNDIKITGFNLEQYLKTEFPLLKESQNKQYEKQKELLRFIIRMQGLIYYHKFYPNRLVQEKFAEFQSELSQENLELIDKFELKDYFDNNKFSQFQDFIEKFQKMKVYNNVPKDKYLDWGKYTQFVQNNQDIHKKAIVEELMIKYPEIFTETQALVKLKQQSIVDELLLWGVYTNEPMAIYLGQKLAMQTGQLIPHELALKVGRMLSYKRPLKDDFINKCKQCLKVVGKIDREFIYSFDKQYEHIMIRKNFRKYVEDQIQQKTQDSKDLEDLLTINPRQYLFSKQSRIFNEYLKSRSQLL